MNANTLQLLLLGKCIPVENNKRSIFYINSTRQSQWILHYILEKRLIKHMKHDTYLIITFTFFNPKNIQQYIFNILKTIKQTNNTDLLA
jgi:hypothetical protein